VLLKFRAVEQANDFLSAFSGKPFSSSQTETCHPIRIHHLLLHRLEDANSVLPASRPTSPSGDGTRQVIPAFPPSLYASRNPPFLAALLKGIPPKTAYELPTCPVCLERMDSIVTGLITTPCSHVFHCKCLSKWGDSRCPVCRYSHLLLAQSDSGRRRASGSADLEPALTTCSMCPGGENRSRNNWMCVLCGVVGCSRYEKGHAREHFLQTGHVFAMEIDTQRVWDYVEDK
jgi:BRCA1-associated protein